ncbi:exopolyphosphatase/guanosine-5'-triphosphate,3'-diphosphate pyrophosphatase [Pedobacter sp. CAN_A7]|uniref:Ppx/GppA phosphatase family protein n=1 Tax=Pedobacter sp. CAN_A7 TaxID=2787722 RepID=UPI0018C9F1C2
MKAGVIDMGTNTFHLIIADLSHGEVDITYKTNIPVKLGEGRLNDNIIIPEAFERGLQALTQFSETLKEQQVQVVKATATSAVRNASNGPAFVQAVKERTGIDIEVISGDIEANYIFKGVQATGVITDTTLIMDIGGGSTEFILCDTKQLLWKKSYDLGAARLLQAYFKSDPISEANQSAIIQHVDQQIKELKEACQLHQPKVLVGSAGAFETFALLLQKGVDLKSLAWAPLSLPGYQQLSAQLIASTHAQRAQMEDLIPLRVDMIVIAALLTDYVLKTFAIPELRLSTYDLKMGVLHTLLQEHQQLNG